MRYTINHFNINVLDLQKSIDFYKTHLSLTEVRRNEKENFTLVYLSDESKTFLLELTYLHDRLEPYDLGDNESHFALMVDDYETSLKNHQAAGVVVLVNQDLGIYFIEDPDGYWAEIIPNRLIQIE
ncbi:VOC family protein [[Mycoplasma] testudinis]|uniref:VOC family protein n=1 Tax=[Mycoplasma] testudinis TaxID=33924 RepID=UPI0004864833|nr:VOC family protein [[Mycoplasma] testudinis]